MDEDKVIISIDPGVTTGLAVCSISKELHITPMFIADSREISIIIREVDIAIRTMGADVVIVEDFIGGGFRNKDSKRTIETLGFIRLYYSLIMERKVVVQQPQFRKHAYQEACKLLKSNGITKVHHAKDALAHLVAYCIKEHSYEKKHDVSS